MLVVVMMVAATAVAAPAPATPVPRTEICAGGRSTRELNDIFSGRVEDYNGMDSLRAFALPNGRTLWLMQDSFLTRSGDPRTLAGAVFAHNVGLLQEGSCFLPLHGPTESDGLCGEQGVASYVGGMLTDNCVTWFWPMGGAVGFDGALWVFYAKMVNGSGGGASSGAAPDGMWVARIDVTTLDVLSFAPAPDPGGDVLYGWSVENAGGYSYLFGYSYDQFNVPAPSEAQPNETFLARVPAGRFDQRPEYWDGAAWTVSRGAARPVNRAPAPVAYAMQPRLIDGVWVSVTKVGEWFGSELALDTAPAPQGPWTTVRTVTVPAKTLSGSTNNYAPHLLPWRAANGNLIVALSHNAWSMNPVVYSNPYLYRPTFFEIEPPPAVPRSTLAATSPSLGFVASPPRRALDTRDQGTAVRAGSTLRVDLAGQIRADARAVAVDLVGVDPAADGFVTAWACDEPRPWVSSVNLSATRTQAAFSIVDLSAEQEICLYTSTPTHLVVDVFGAYVDRQVAGAGSFTAAGPTRAYDSRLDRALAPEEVRRVMIAPGATAAAINLAVTSPAGRGFVTVFPCDQARPAVANIHVEADQTLSNFAQVGLSASGELCISGNITTHVVVDVLGTFRPTADGWWYQTVPPTRLVDTREGLGAPLGPVARQRVGQPALPAATVPALTNVPTTARALVVTLVAVQPTRSGWMTAAPCSASYATAALNADAWRTVANLTVTATRAASGRDVCVHSLMPTHQVVDLVGWYVS